MTGYPFTGESEVDVHVYEQCIAIDHERLLPPASGEACHSADPSWTPSEDTSVTPILPRDAYVGCEGGGDDVKVQRNHLLRTSVACQHVLTLGSPDQRLIPNRSKINGGTSVAREKQHRYDPCRQWGELQSTCPH